MSGWLLPNGCLVGNLSAHSGGQDQRPFKGCAENSVSFKPQLACWSTLTPAPRGGQGGWRMLLPLQSGWSWFTPTTHQPATLGQDVERYSAQRTSLVAMGATEAED